MRLLHTGEDDVRADYIMEKMAQICDFTPSLFIGVDI